MSKFQIPLSTYNHVYQVAHGVMRTFGGAEKGCLFFGCFGALVLNKHFKIPARAVAGGFAFCVDPAPKVAFFGERQGDRVASTPEGFHMWVQTETHIIDFMAPIFNESFQAEGVALPRKMFQRTIASEAPSLNDLATLGDYYTLPDPELTETLIDNFIERPSVRDLLGVADTWFGNGRRPPKARLQMGDSHGERYNLTLPQTTAIGAW